MCVASIEATSLVHVNKDTLLRLNIPLAKAVFPVSCFSTLLRPRLESRCREYHQKEHHNESSLETTHKITKLVKYSPRRETLLHEIQLQDDNAHGTQSVAVHTLCPTRWTVWADSMESIIHNYNTLQSLWDQAIDLVRDTEPITRIRGVASQMKSFNYFFGLVLGEVLLRHTDNLSRTLQKNIFASEGQLVANMTRRTLQNMRNGQQFDLFWEKVKRMAEESDVDDPALPRRKTVPQRFETSAAAEFPATAKDHFWRNYFEALDLLVQAVVYRFDQPGYRMYSSLQAFILFFHQISFRSSQFWNVVVTTAARNFQLRLQICCMKI